MEGQNNLGLNKENRMWRMLKRTFVSRDTSFWKESTKIQTELNKINCDQRLAQLGETSLKDGSVRGEYIEMFLKITNGLEVVKWWKELNVKKLSVNHKILLFDNKLNSYEEFNVK